MVEPVDVEHAQVGLVEVSQVFLRHRLLDAAAAEVAPAVEDGDLPAQQDGVVGVVRRRDDRIAVRAQMVRQRSTLIWLP